MTSTAGRSLVCPSGSPRWRSATVSAMFAREGEPTWAHERFRHAVAGGNSQPNPLRTVTQIGGDVTKLPERDTVELVAPQPHPKLSRAVHPTRSACKCLCAGSLPDEAPVQSCNEPVGAVDAENRSVAPRDPDRRCAVMRPVHLSERPIGTNDATTTRDGRHNNTRCELRARRARTDDAARTPVAAQDAVCSGATCQRPGRWPTARTPAICRLIFVQAEQARRTRFGPGSVRLAAAGRRWLRGARPHQFVGTPAHYSCEA